MRIARWSANHGAHTKAIDKPVAVLLADPAQRGLLDDTLVVWTSGFADLWMVRTATVTL